MKTSVRRRFLIAVECLQANRTIAHPRVYRPRGKLETLLIKAGLPAGTVTATISSMRALSQESFGKTHYPPAEVVAKQLLKEPSKANMREMIGNYHPRTQIARALLILLEAKDPQVCEIARWGISMLEVRSLATPLALLARNPNPWTRACAVDLLGALKLRSKKNLLAKALQDPIWQVRCRAIHAIGDGSMPELIPDVIGMLRDRVPGVRASAVGVLRILKAKDALTAIRALASDPDSLVRENVVWALKELGNQDSSQPN